MRFSYVLALAGLALSAPIVDDHAAVIDLTTSLVFNKTLQEFNAWRAEGTGPIQLMVDTEGCPMGPGAHGQHWQDACHRREFALKTYKKQGRLTKNAKKQINLKFKGDLLDVCPGPLLGFPCSESAKTYYQTIRAYGKTRAAKIMARHFIEPETAAADDKQMPCDLARQALKNGTATQADIEEIQLCDFLEFVYNQHPMPNSSDSLTRRKELMPCDKAMQAVLNGTATEADIKEVQLCDFLERIYHHTPMPKSSDSLKPRNELMPCNKAKEAVLNGTATEADIKKVQLCDSIEHAYNDYLRPKSTDPLASGNKVPSKERRGGWGLKCLGSHYPYAKRGDMTGSDSDYEPCNTSVGSEDSRGDFSVWEVEYVEPYFEPTAAPLNISSNGPAETAAHMRLPRMHDHRDQEKRDDMSGSNSDFQPGHTSAGSDASHDSEQGWYHPRSSKQNGQVKRSDMSGSNSDFQPGHTSAGSEDSQDTTPHWEPPQALRPRMHDPRCQVDGWDKRKRGDMTGSDSDFEPCGTSLGSAESGMEWSVWEVERLPSKPTDSSTTITKRKKRTAAVLRTLLEDPAERSNPHIHGEREALLKKYCGMLQYDVEVWGKGVGDGIGDGIGEDLEEKVMMSTCRMLGYYRVHDSEVNHHSEVSEVVMTTDDEACPGMEDCEGLVGTEYNTTESDEDEPAPAKRGLTKPIEPMRKVYEDLIFKADIQDFMDRLFTPVDKYKGCANLRESEHGWNFHDSCIRHEYGFSDRWLIRNDSADIAQEDAKAKARVNEVLKQDLNRECRSHNIRPADGGTPLQVACFQLARLYHMIVVQVGSKSAAPMFDTLQEEIVRGVPTNYPHHG